MGNVNIEYAITGILRRLDVLESREISDSGWLGLSYATGWVDFGSGAWNNGEYRRVDNMVHLRGLVKRTSGTSLTIATIPSGFRPTGDDRHNVQIDDGTTSTEKWLDIDASTGDLKVETAASFAYVSLVAVYWFTD